MPAWLSNCGGSENPSNRRNGKKGDQTGTEYYMRSWYSSPWLCVLRYPDQRVAKVISALAVQAAKNEHIGYGQSDRLTMYDQLIKNAAQTNYLPSRITTNCNADCASSTCAVIIAAGYITGVDSLKNLSNCLCTSWMRAPMKAAGFDCLIGSKWTGGTSNLQAGDVLLNDNAHVAIWTDGEESTDGVAGFACGGYGGALYQTKNTRDDMLIREFGYASANYEPSINSTNIRMSALNYTTMAAGIWTIFVQKFGIAMAGSAPYMGGDANVNALTDQNARIAANFFLNKGLNPAATCGILANIKAECSFKTNTTGDWQFGGGGGICGWLNQKGFRFWDMMKEWVRANYHVDWTETMEGQCAFLWHTLTDSSFNYYDKVYGKSLLNVLKSVPNSEEGARTAAVRFVTVYERPAYLSLNQQRRGNWAVEFFRQIRVMS